MVRGPAATTRLQADPGAEPKLRYLAKGSVPDHGNDAVSDGHREYDYLDWIARLTSHIPEKGAQLVHYYGAYSNGHRGIAARREVFARSAIEGPEVGRFDVRRVGVALVVRAGFVDHADLGASILAWKGAGRGFVGRSAREAARRAVKVDPAGRGPGRWTARCGKR